MVNEIVNNKVNLCDSCSQVYPDCTSKPENVYFGDGIGNDNICACSEYRPKTCGDGDMISRQDAIKAVAYGALSSATLFGRSDAGMTALRDTVRAIEQLPSAQPKIIRCKDCKYYQFADSRAFGMPVKMCKWFGFEDVDNDDFCSRAERR